MMDVLNRIVGEAYVCTDEAARTFYSRDLFADDAPLAAAVVSPADEEEVAQVLGYASRSLHPVSVRGGGMSYTGGYAPISGAILLDMRRLDAVEVDPAAMSATVGAGATWFALAALAGRQGLETALVGPASGECSTIGGALSQGLPGDMAGVTGLHVVGADGRIYETGGFTRNLGPDTTGVFLGDCGTLGVKTRATLRLRRKSSGHADASLAFASLTDLAAAAAAVARTGLAKRCLGLDPIKSRTATKVGVGEGLSTLGRVVSDGRSTISGLMQAARVISSLAQTPPKDAWMLHLSCEGPTDTAAAALLAAARLDVQGVIAEVEPTIPIALRARPFRIRGLAGAGGERWVPVNGIVALDKAHSVAHALETWADTHASALAAANIGWSMLVSATPMQILFEPMFTWADALAPVAAAALGERRERLPHHAPDPTTRALVKRYRADVRDLLDAYGAVHVGYGGYYGYGSALIETLRRALDPAGILSTHNLSRST